MIANHSLYFTGFDSYLALKGIQWDDKQYFFEALEESITGLTELEDNDEFKLKIKSELAANNQSMAKFKLKLGHKNLIINLCHELQKTNFEDFNGSHQTVQKIIPDNNNRQMAELVVRKQPDEEHGYSRDDEEQLKPIKRQKLDSTSSNHQYQEITDSSEVYEQVQYIYETEEDEEGSQYIDQSDYIDEGTEIVEYQEITENENEDSDAIYSAEQVVKQEADNFEQSESIHFSPYASIRRVAGLKNSKKPKHMYNDEFLQTQSCVGRIGTPGRRRPKIQKNYPETEEGMLERWCDLVRQSCEVIVPHELLSKFDLSHVDIVKICPFIWEVSCPLCSKKLRLQLTHEGKYINFKRSNFERHLRIVHFKQIAKSKFSKEEPGDGDGDVLEDVTD